MEIIVNILNPHIPNVFSATITLYAGSLEKAAELLNQVKSRIILTDDEYMHVLVGCAFDIQIFDDTVITSQQLEEAKANREAMDEAWAEECRQAGWSY